LTASPGSDNEVIQEVLKNLFIEEIEVRTEEDPDVKPYVKEIGIEWIKVELPKEFIKVKDNLKRFLKSRYQNLKKIGILQKHNLDFVSKTDLLQLQAQLQGRIAKGEKTPQMWMVYR
jgi:ERCC4-related helicase